MISRIAVTLSAVTLALVWHCASAAPSGANPWDGMVDAAARRLLAADPVAVAKWHSHQPIDAPGRERQVLATVTEQAGRLGLDRGYAQRVFRDQLDATKAVEYARIAAWTRDPASAPRAGSGLTAIRVLIDALDRDMVERLAGNVAAAGRPGCRADVAAAAGRAAARYRLDPVTARALRDATRDYCLPDDTSGNR
jgi:chorismate mutase